jgi:hypothetical protein
MTTGLLFTITAIVTAVLGVSWLFFPATMLSLWKASGSEITLYMSRRYAGLFFGYSVMLWLGRTAPPSPARDAIVAGGLAVTAVMAIVSLVGVVRRTVGPATWGTVVIEAVLAGGFGYLLLSGRS